MSNKVIGSNIANRLTVLAKAITGWQPEGVDNRELNQVLFQGVTDHIWGTLAQVTAGEADFYTDGSGNPLNASAAAVTINEDDKILIRHDVVQTANLILDCGGVKFTLEMYGGVTLNMGAFDLTIGGTADETAGSIEVIGTGTLTIEDANGFRVSHTAMTVVTLAGDSVVNNAVLADNFAIDWEATGLVMSLPTVATVNIAATKIQLVSDENVIKIKEGLDHTLTMPADLNAGTEKPSTDYETYISANVAGTIGGKLVPILTGTTTATNSGFLVDGGQTFLDDLVLQNSIVVNNTDGISTTCSIDAAANNTFAVTDDIFTIGEEYTIYLVPTFDSGHIFFAKTGKAFNDAGNDFTVFEKFSNTVKTARMTTAHWRTFNNYGSVNNKIAKFSIEEVASNDIVVTVVNSASDGFSVTANMKCILIMVYTVGFGSGTFYGGISKNTTQPTTAITALTNDSERVSQVYSGAQQNDNAVFNNIIEEYDIVMPHNDGSTVGASPQDSLIQILAIEIL